MVYFFKNREFGIARDKLVGGDGMGGELLSIVQRGAGFYREKSKSLWVAGGGEWSEVSSGC